MLYNIKLWKILTSSNGNPFNLLSMKWKIFSRYIFIDGIIFEYILKETFNVANYGVTMVRGYGG